MSADTEKRSMVEHANLALFWGMHLAPLAVILTGSNFVDWIVCIALYVARMFWITAGYHRYFSHRAFKTNRISQFLLAFFAQTSVQKGVLWWASHHRFHHRYSDQHDDAHSPVQHGFWQAHCGWILSDKTSHVKWKYIKDLSKYPELVWLDKYHQIPAILLALTCYLVGGWSMLLIGFVLSTVVLFHGTFTINSLSHIWGKRRFKTTDGSRNNFLLALITLGEGWHNNHHFFPHSARQGFFWKEIDITYYVLWFMRLFGVVRDMRPVPARILQQRSVKAD